MDDLIYDAEWWRNKFCGRSSGVEGVCRLSLTAEGSEEGIWILYQSVHQVGIHARTCPALWGIMGGGSAKHENSRRIVSTIKLNFEELTTVLLQVESCMNSQPLVAMPSDDNGVEALICIPEHFPHWLSTGGYSWFSSILQSLTSLLMATLSVSTMWFLEKMVNWVSCQPTKDLQVAPTAQKHLGWWRCSGLWEGFVTN